MFGSFLPLNTRTLILVESKQKKKEVYQVWVFKHSTFKFMIDKVRLGL